MKKFLTNPLLLLVLALSVIGLAASNNDGGQYGDAGRLLYFQYAPDTITNTELDTLYAYTSGSTSFGFRSAYTYNLQMDATQLSGTTDLILILQERNSEDSDLGWYEVERDTLNGAGTLRLHGASAADGLGHVKGVHQRVIIDGDGTQSSRYTMSFRYKPEE